MPGAIAVAHEGADADAAVGKVADLGERQAVDVHDAHRLLDIALHEVDQVRAAGKEFRIRRDRGERLVDARGALIGKGVHG